MSGWISLHRKILDWEWYDDANVCRLFIHCLLKANHQQKNWKGITIDRGSFITSLDKLSRETGLSVSQIRTGIKKLKSTNEIASKSHTQHTVISIVSYDSYQGNDKPNDKPVTNESQTNDKQIATTNNDNNENNDNNRSNRLDYDRIKEIFNSNLTKASSVIKLTDKRKKLVKKLFDEFDLDYDKFANYLTFLNNHPNAQWMFEERPKTDGSGQSWQPQKFEYFVSERCFLNAKENL